MHNRDLLRQQQLKRQRRHKLAALGLVGAAALGLWALFVVANLYVYSHIFALMGVC